ncbi:hypothetical protein [Pectobacterium polaris]|uniref:Uncharacterized protein n=1 Tax=Pectobacterium polaris TaxID=2042057 RepID=A0AAW5GHC2_9GAMM|nr:hypothetical protein [Pectobacterium polaris]MCL6353382.1 hypothetical protein [Pectobacterium polaris]MCL6370784.1 hypothetical protein [Pectobacterium polaris]
MKIELVENIAILMKTSRVTWLFSDKKKPPKRDIVKPVSGVYFPDNLPDIHTSRPVHLYQYPVTDKEDASMMSFIEVKLWCQARYLL